MPNVSDKRPPTECIGQSRGEAPNSRSSGTAVSLDGPGARQVHAENGPPLGGPGSCSHSYRYVGRASTHHPRCERPSRLMCDRCGDQIIGRCGSSRSKRCKPCGESHRRRLAQVVQSGVTGNRFGQWFWVTITAPGVDVLPFDPESCSHNPEVECSGKLGCKVGEFDAAIWNGTAPRRWSWFMTYLRRRLGEQVQYCGVWEYQERGVLHRHFLVRVERPTSERRVRAAVRGAARRWSFGSQYDVQSITGDAARQVWYCAKYASKTVDAVDGRRVLDIRTGELKASRGFRAWSASREWGDTMRAVKHRQMTWARTGGGASSPMIAAAGAAGVGLDPNSEISTVDLVGSVGALIVPVSAPLL